MLACKLAARIEEQSRAVERRGVTFDHADDKSRTGIASELAECVRLRSRHVDRFAPVFQERFASFRRAIAHARAKIRPLRIAAQRRFRYHNQLCTGVTDRARVADNAVECGGTALGS